MITLKDILNRGIGTRFVVKRQAIGEYYPEHYNEYICADISPDKTLIKINSEWVSVENPLYFDEIVFII